MEKPLITGITGQDGAYLAEFLLGKGDFVVAAASELEFLRRDDSLVQGGFKLTNRYVS